LNNLENGKIALEGQAFTDVRASAQCYVRHWYSNSTTKTVAVNMWHHSSCRRHGLRL